MEQLTDAWKLEKRDCYCIAEIIRYALSTIRRTGFETYQGVATFGLLQREVDTLEEIYFQITGQFLDKEYGGRMLKHFQSNTLYRPAELSLAKEPANNANEGEQEGVA